MDLKIKGVSLVKCTLSPGETEVTVPRGIRIIEWAAFASCANLRRVTLPEGIFEIRRNAFQGCRKLTDINLPERIRSIQESAFADCISLRRVLLPETLTALGARAFQNCTSLLQIRLPRALTRIENMTFSGCRNLQRVLLPAALREIGQGAFQYCTALEQIKCPASMTSIEERAFYNCTALKRIGMPEKMQQLGDQCFMNCTSLTGLSLPEGITRLSDSLCKNCTALTQLVFPSTLDDRISRWSIDSFGGCTKLTHVLTRGTLSSTIRYNLHDFAQQLQQLFVASPDALGDEDCRSGTASKTMALLALRTYAGNLARFSPETQAKYNRFLSDHAKRLCDQLIDHADLIELMCRENLIPSDCAEEYINASFEKPAQLGRLLRYLCGRISFPREKILSLLSRATAIEHSEASAVLLQYLHEHFPDVSDEDDDDPFALPDLCFDECSAC